MTTVVEIEQGTLRGQRSAHGVGFKGIPYAADTGGGHRFMPPQAAPRWAGVRDASAFGDRCPQTVENIVQLPMFTWYGQASAFSENCCVLNVYTPGLQADARRPVIVYLHGGGYASGGGGGAALDGSRLAAFGDVVVVTVNHRLNLFGYTQWSHLGDDRFADAGHAGHLDLVAALRWVQAHIAAFGGDAGNVTLMGQSGGGNKVMALLVMPQARGLFKRVINMGGASGLELARPAQTRAGVEALAQRLGVRAGDLGRLQSLPVANLLQARREAMVAARQDPAQPVVDGRHVLASPFSNEGLAMHAAVPMLIGSTDTEATLFLGQDRRNFSIDEAELLARIEAEYTLDRAQARALVAAYREQADVRSATDVLVQLSSDVLARGHLIRAAQAKAAAGGAPVYLYNFAWRIGEDGGVWRSPHTADIPFAFGTLDCAPSMTGPEVGADAAVLSRRLMSAFVAFARHGDPNHPDLPAWAPYEATRRATLVFDTPCRLVHDHRGIGRIASAPLLRLPPAALLRGPLFRGTA